MFVLIDLNLTLSVQMKRMSPDEARELARRALFTALNDDRTRASLGERGVSFVTPFSPDPIVGMTIHNAGDA